MNHHRQTNGYQKSDDPYSFENLSQFDIRARSNGESVRSTTMSSTQRGSYPIVPKRAQPSASSSQQSVLTSIPTTSRINIIPSTIQTNPHVHPTSSNQHVHNHHALDLIRKYTSIPETFGTNNSAIENVSHRASSSSIDTRANQPVNFPKIKLKNKRSLSPPVETSKPTDSSISLSKRPKSFLNNIDEDENDEDEDIKQFLDHRRSKYVATQSNHTTTCSSQSTTIDIQERKPTVRKPTVRKTSIGRQTPAVSPPLPVAQSALTVSIESDGTLLIEPDTDTDEEDMHTECQSSNDKSAVETKIKDQSVSTMLIVKSTDRFSSNLKSMTSVSAEKSPSERSVSSSLFETPRSSLSRTTTSGMDITPKSATKNEAQSESSLAVAMHRLITQSKLRVQNSETKIDYDPIDLVTKLFRENVSFSSNETSPTTTKHQRLVLGRYEIETIFPVDNNKISIIYACDLCLKHFYGSSIASQRHTNKCTYTRPPGELLYETNDVAIFQIGETSMNIEQRIYIESLCRIARLFLDMNINIDRFAYYILCRKDPLVPSSKPSLYRLIGFFSKQLHQYRQQASTNLSHLFILPSYSSRQDYKHLLIAFSYFLAQSKLSSTNTMYCSPVRPLDKINFRTMRIYWREVILSYIHNQMRSSMKSIALEAISRYTLIHPRDIISTLHFDGLLIRHPTDKTSVCLRIDHPLSSNQTRSQLFTNLKSTTVDNKIIDKNNDSGIEEIVLD